MTLKEFFATALPHDLARVHISCNVSFVNEVWKLECELRDERLNTEIEYIGIITPGEDERIDRPAFRIRLEETWKEKTPHES